MTNYKLSGDNKGESLVVIYDEDDPVTVPGTHPKFDEILSLLRKGEAEDEDVKLLVNTLHAVGSKLSQITDRVSVAPYGVFFDGDPLRTELADVILRALQDGDEENLTAFARFLENAAANQSMEGIDALYRWISNRDLVLNPDGMFLAYKGVRLKDGEYSSITHGTAMVDGVTYTGSIPNPLGSVISMPRSEVTANNNIGCGAGLHAGTHAYASGFAQGGLLLVEINPRDVVSVPNDSSFQKLRVSKYKVIEQIEDRISKPFYTPESFESEYDPDIDDEYYDEYDEYDEWDDEEDYDEDEDGLDGDFTDDREVEDTPETVEEAREEAKQEETKGSRFRKFFFGD